ncbi:MAG: TldD/PmbA family protein [Acidimicrobiia bacterium]|nr:TldD/PmbA family protein [Acidimicrobiia bacterium]
MTGEELLAIGVRVAERAERHEQIEAFVAAGDRTSIRAYEGEVESFTQATTAGIGVRVVRDGRQGFAHAGTLDPDIVGEVVAEARDNLAFAQVDPHAGLAEPDGVEPPSLDSWNRDLAGVSVDAKIAAAVELERRVRTADPRISGVRTASYSDSSGAVAVASSTGILATDRASFCSIGVQALARDGDENQTGYGFDVARSFGDLSVDKAADDAVERAVRMLGARQPRSERMTVVLEARMASSIVGIVAGMLSGDRVAKGRTPFGDRMGELVASPLLSLKDDPTDVRSFAADAFDGEGLASRATPLITAGVLTGFLHDTWSARRLGAESTASAVRGTRSTPVAGARALAMTPGRGDLDELLESVDRGILVQAMSGLHSGVNAISGDFSVGIEGLAILDGRRSGAIREATMASTVQRLLSGIAAVGGELEWQPGGTGACALVIDDVAISGS